MTSKKCELGGLDAAARRTNASGSVRHVVRVDGIVRFRPGDGQLAERLGLFAEEVEGGEKAVGGGRVERAVAGFDGVASQLAWMSRKASLLVRTRARQRMAVVMPARMAASSWPRGTSARVQ
jgi:hypothetical protein